MKAINRTVRIDYFKPSGKWYASETVEVPEHCVLRYPHKPDGGFVDPHKVIQWCDEENEAPGLSGDWKSARESFCIVVSPEKGYPRLLPALGGSW